MITYSFPIKNSQNFSQIVSALEIAFSAVMHTTSPLPTSLTDINGSVGMVCSPEGCILYVYFYENANEYQLKNSSGNVIYQSKALTTIPSKTEVQNVIGDLL